MQMTQNLPPPHLVADHRALDFLNTVGAPFGVEIDWLATGTNLVSWLSIAGLLDPGQTEIARNGFTDRDLDWVASQAIELREWFRDFLVDQCHAAEWRLDQADLEPINRILADGTYGFRLVTEGHGQASLRGDCLLKRPDDLLFPIALAIADFITTDTLKDVRTCAGDSCTFWFVDRTKNKKRRWCDMKVCGNRAKAATFRARKVER